MLLNSRSPKHLWLIVFSRHRISFITNVISWFFQSIFVLRLKYFSQIMVVFCGFLFVCLSGFFFLWGGGGFNVWEAGCSKVEMGRGNIFLFELCYSEWLLGWLLALVDFVVLLVCRPDQSVLFTHLGV